MILGDLAIREAMETGELSVMPLPRPEAIQPSSLELRLAETVTLAPGEFRLSHTLEYVKISPTLVAHVHGKSSLGRLGLLVHVTAGLIDPGFQGQIVLELKNVQHLPDPVQFETHEQYLDEVEKRTLRLGQHQPVCQLQFHTVTEVQRPYGHPELGSHYQGQTGTTPSYLYLRRQREREDWVRLGRRGPRG